MRALSIGTSLIGRIATVSVCHPLVVLFAALALTAAAVVYLAQNFAMTADTSPNFTLILVQVLENARMSVRGVVMYHVECQ